MLAASPEKLPKSLQLLMLWFPSFVLLQLYPVFMIIFENTTCTYESRGGSDQASAILELLFEAPLVLILITKYGSDFQPINSSCLKGLPVLRPPTISSFTILSKWLTLPFIDPPVFLKINLFLHLHTHQQDIANHTFQFIAALCSYLFVKFHKIQSLSGREKNVWWKVRETNCSHTSLAVGRFLRAWGLSSFKLPQNTQDSQ